MIGYAPAEIIGRFAGEVNIYANLADRQEVMRLLQEHGSVHDHEVLLQGKTGELHSVVVSVEPLEFEGEECLLTALLDVTERKRMEDELRRSNAELEQFAYIASHDLQEPLRTIAGMVQLLQKRYQGQLDERADEYIGHTVESASRMQALIRDLLAYSRVDRKNQPIAPVSAQDCLQSALKNLRVAIEESHATITADDLPTVHADPTQLTQLFQNLIGNSLKFHSAEPPQVHITATQLPDAWQFAVRDNGIGIEPQYFERIFLVFQRLHTRRQYQGTGIGLALCKKIIERHGGSIWLESKPGQGSIFYFTLPLRSNP
jgi:light-regulated signal transduction histidine kinase (bacteriophytochrome)